MFRLQVHTDGRRDCIERTIASARDALHGELVERVIYDDSGDLESRRWLEATFPDFEVIGAPTRQGFGGAIIGAWRDIEQRSRALWVFHLEDDFVFNRPVDLLELASILAANRHLAQMALRRQPWNDAERTAGGIVEQHPGEYVEQSDELGRRWLEHRLFFTTNPCVYSTDLIRAGWPTGQYSEGRFTHQLLADGLPWGVPGDDVRFAFYGARDSGEAVEHIGHTRAGTGY